MPVRPSGTGGRASLWHISQSSSSRKCRFHLGFSLVAPVPEDLRPCVNITCSEAKMATSVKAISLSFTIVLLIAAAATFGIANAQSSDPVVRLSTQQPVGCITMTATLSHTIGVEDLEWTWKRSTDKSTWKRPWIRSSTSSYTPNCLDPRRWRRRGGQRGRRALPAGNGELRAKRCRQDRFGGNGE